MPYVISLAEVVKQLSIAYADLSILLVASHFEEVEELLHSQIQLEEAAQVLKAHDCSVDVRSTLTWSTLHDAEYLPEEL